MRGDRAFIDTNVFVYLCSNDPGRYVKAFSVFERYECLTSVQVSMEFCSVCTRKLHIPIAKVKRMHEAVIKSRCHLCGVSEMTVDRALDIQDRYGYSFYDSVMAASALEHDCRYLISEDMQDGHKIGTLTIFNVFAVEHDDEQA